MEQVWEKFDSFNRDTLTQTWKKDQNSEFSQQEGGARRTQNPFSEFACDIVE